MAASIPAESKFWLDGQVWPVMINASHDAGTEKFWLDGRTWEGLSPVAASESSEMIVARASISMP